MALIFYVLCHKLKTTMHGYELEEMKVTAETKSPIILFILQAGKGIL